MAGAAGGQTVRRRAAERAGIEAEAAAASMLERDGWRVLGRRLRFGKGGGAGEIDLAVEKDGLLAFVEVKARRTLSDAAYAVSERQKARLLAGAEAALAANPGWGAAGVRFDAVLVDAAGRVRRIADAWRAG